MAFFSKALILAICLNTGAGQLIMDFYKTNSFVSSNKKTDKLMSVQFAALTTSAVPGTCAGNATATMPQGSMNMWTKQLLCTATEFHLAMYQDSACATLANAVSFDATNFGKFWRGEGAMMSAFCCEAGTSNNMATPKTDYVKLRAAPTVKPTCVFPATTTAAPAAATATTAAMGVGALFGSVLIAGIV